jgi:hypothetical protein
MSAQICDNVDFDTPVSRASALTRSSTFRVDVIVTYAVMITPPWARSIRRRDSSRSGKKLPFRSLGILTSTPPAGVDTILGRDPFRTLLRSSERSQRPAPSRAVTSTSSHSAARPARPWTAHLLQPLHSATRGEHVLDG